MARGAWCRRSRSPCAGATSWCSTPGAARAPGRVLVFASHGFALRAIWLPPTAQRAAALAPVRHCRRRRTDAHSSPTSRTVRCTSSIAAGTWRAAWAGFGAVAAHGRRPVRPRSILWSPASRSVRISGPRRESDRDWRPTSTRSATASRHCPALPATPDGRINLAGRCAGAGWFDAGGKPSAGPRAGPARFAASGVWLSYRARQPHRALPMAPRCAESELAAAAPSLTLQTFTAEVEQPIELIAALPPTAWTAVPLLGRCTARKR